MPTPLASENFADLLDPRFERIQFEAFNETRDMIPEFYSVVPHNGRADMRWSQVADFGDIEQFTGSVPYQDVAQGFDSIMTFVEFASGFQVKRKLFDDDQYNVMDGLPRALARAAARTRQKHGARILNNAFSVDSFFYVNSEGVALCSDSHASASGAGTATGFDNLTTAALSATALTAARKQHVKLKSDNANIIEIVPDEIWIHPDNYDIAFEIVASMGKVDTAENNRNVHEGAYTVREWIYLNDSNNWFLTDSAMRKESCMWVDRVPMEFAMAEDFDALIGKWRTYGRWANIQRDWRWGVGAQVS